VARYFLELAYNGTRYHGYQIQPNGLSIQEAVQNALSVLLKRKIDITGCGRTDSGVHAFQYFAHFDFEGEIPANLIYSLNGILKKDIVFYRIIPVHDSAHARFDAISRSYVYYIDLRPNPFRQETAYYCPFADKLDKELIQKAAAILLGYKDFESFCLTDNDAKTKICHLTRSEWIFNDWDWEFHISSDRFLRGMIRLIVGMCLNIGKGKISLEELRDALEHKKALEQAWSAPASGLFLTDIKYKFIQS
jgi:tRNA pseudouridine38-40 synthase